MSSKGHEQKKQKSENFNGDFLDQDANHDSNGSYDESHGDSPKETRTNTSEIGNAEISYPSSQCISPGCSQFEKQSEHGPIIPASNLEEVC